MIDNRAQIVHKSQQALFAHWCDRRFGIGADGVILLQTHPDHDFEMVYINADGREGSMCGNGGRCTVQFAHDLGIIDGKTRFLAIDGVHHADMVDGMVHLEMQSVGFPEKAPEGGFYLNTGSPHHLAWVAELDTFDVANKGKALRWHPHYAPGGTNVNFLEKRGDNLLAVRTFERGVEAETFSCGTGVTAAALLLAYELHWEGNFEVSIQTAGGMLKVRANRTDTGYSNVFLIGPASRVFEGSV